MDRRHFLQAAAVGAASVAADAPPKKEADNKPKFRLGLVTYNLAANWDLPSLLKACHALAFRQSSCAPPTSTASNRP